MTIILKKNSKIIHCLRERFAIDEIYTAVGDILIALNPYVRLPLYTPEKVYEYSHRGTKRLPPHVFDTASRAYMGQKNKKEKETSDQRRNRSFFDFLGSW